MLEYAKISGAPSVPKSRTLGAAAKFPSPFTFPKGVDADGGRSWDYPDSEEDSEDYNTDGSDDLDLPEHLRPSDAEMARRAARYPLPI